MATFVAGFDQTRQLARRFSRTPMFTAITLITLAVAVGANAVIFSVIEGVLLKPLPYPHPEQLIGVWHHAPGVGFEDLNMAPFLYFTNREQSRTLQDIGVYDGDSLTVTGVGEPEHVQGLDVSDGTLPILGVVPALGRLFTRADDTAGAPQTVLLSNAYWRKKFGADPKVIGRSITLDGKPRQIIGVLPKGFQFLDMEDTAVVLPFQWDRNKTKLGNFSYQALARLKPGVSMAQVNADLARLIPIAIGNFPAPEGFSAKIFESAKLSPNLRPLKKDVIGDVGKTLWVLMGSLIMVLLIACANVANLLLVRVEGRRQELAVRAALGAGSKRIAGELLMESFSLGLVGSLVGLGLAYGALRLLIALAPTGLPRLHEIGIDLPVLLFTLLIAILTSLLIGAIPVLRYAREGSNLSLREGGRGQSQSREQHRTRNALVILQVALALVLLICSGLMIRTFNSMMHIAPGFAAPDSLQTFHVFIPESTVPDKDPQRLLHMEQDIRDKIAAISGVSSVAFGSRVPMDGGSSNDVLYTQDRTYSEGQLPPIRRFKYVSPGYFSTLGTPLLAGRDFSWSDNYQQLPVAIISENFAREFWHDPANALGKRIRVSTKDDWREIVGVAADVHDDGVSKAAPTTVYWPVLMARFESDDVRMQRFLTIVIRSQRAGSESFMKEVQQAVWSTDSDLPLADVRTLGFLYKRSMARTSFTLVLLSVAGAMALLLGVVGIYGVISYSVSQRTREIGIRMALGAQREVITGMFVRHGLLLTGIGVGFGLVASLITMRLMSSLLFNVSPVDPLTYGTITAVILVISYVACYLPSRRAATVEPVNALRSE
ncbi:ABC transporter permease [Acidicapsa acidisoli]|uniref:ABC transporter permease n=1 Tax=Acidicapsa acidisoli TaxID=1615681 RepID=UPI0021DF7E14|nr:ABC transporter permease [Acidicapsa acidisoli]